MTIATVVPNHSIIDKARNAGLASLTPAARALLEPYLTEHIAETGRVLWEPGRSASWTYFPTSAVISVVVAARDGSSIEVANIGRESAACASFESHDTEATTRGMLCIGGAYVRSPTERLLAAAAQNKEVRALVDRCRDWMLVQAQQIAACNTLHSADKRFARWLLTCSEKLNTPTITATQEQIAGLLGIRRATLSLIAQSLLTQGLIEYRRGRINIMDRAKLSAAACECCDRLGRAHWVPAAEAV
jgi:hypothetical protein